MKFFTAAVGSFLLSMASVDARKPITRAEVDARIMEGKVDKKTILSKAIPYKQYLRRAEEGQNQQEQYNDNGDYYYEYYEQDYDQDVGDYAEEVYGDNQIEDEDYERITVTESTYIKFNSCVVMQTQNYNLYMDNLINSAKSGRIDSIRNYVLFELCTNQSCKNKNWFSKANANLYMIDLATFIEAAIAYGPSEQERVCTACKNYADVCGYEGGDNYNNNKYNVNNYNYDGDADADADADADGEDQDADDGQRRQLEGVQYEIFNRQTCNRCSAFDCWYDSEGDQEIDAEAIEEWTLEINECRESETQWNGLNLYAGWMCSEDGTGIDVGVFIDPYCRMRQIGTSFSTIMEDDDYQYFYQSQDVVPMMFDVQIGCADTADAQFVDYDTWKAMGYDEQDQNDEENINELCETIFYGEFAPRSLGNCGTPMNITSKMIVDAQEAEYQNNQNQDGQQNMYQYLQSQQMLYNNYNGGEDWQTYDLSATDVLDGYATCTAVAEKVTGQGNSGGGFLSGGLPWRNGSSAMSTPSAKLTPLEIAWIVLVAVIGTALFMHYTRKQIIKRKGKRAAAKNDKQVYQRTDDKGTPLIIS